MGHGHGRSTHRMKHPRFRFGWVVNRKKGLWGNKITPPIMQGGESKRGNYAPGEPGCGKNGDTKYKRSTRKKKAQTDPPLREKKGSFLGIERPQVEKGSGDGGEKRGEYVRKKK